MPNKNIVYGLGIFVLSIAKELSEFDCEVIAVDFRCKQCRSSRAFCYRMLSKGDYHRLKELSKKYRTENCLMLSL